MAELSITINQAQLNDLNHLMSQMGGRAANRALSRAINRTLGVKYGGMRKTISDEIRKDANLRQAYIYKQTGRKTTRTFSVTRATVNKPTGVISTQGPNVPIIEYAHRRAKKRVYVTVQKSRGRSRLSHAWFGQSKFGSKGRVVFAKAHPGAKGKLGRKIKELYSSRVPDVLNNPGTIDRVLKVGQDRFERELSHQIDHILKYNK